MAVKQQKKDKKSRKLRLVFWAFALGIYGVVFALYLTYLGPYVLELMRWAGVWKGLGGAVVGFLLALTMVPAILTLKLKKAAFGKTCLMWAILILGLLAGLAPVGDWFEDRGSFVPALLLGPESVVVERVVIDKIGWGDGWKVRPEGAEASPEAVSSPLPSASPTP